MTKPARFTQSDITRVFKGAVQAGVRARVEIDPEGRMVVTMLGDPANDEGPNPCDRLFK
jgi:hypothetical protein